MEHDANDTNCQCKACQEAKEKAASSSKEEQHFGFGTPNTNSNSILRGIKKELSEESQK